MAHLGKRYPVAFRRDINLNLIDKRFYWPRVWRVKGHDLTGTIGSALSTGTVVFSQEYDPRTLLLPEWRSGFGPVNGRSVDIRLLVAAGMGHDFDVTGQVWDSVQGKIWEFTFPVNHDSKYNEWGILVALSNCPQPTLFAPGPGFPVIQYEWSTWTEVNSL
jgi:hypothetical protein